MYKLAQLLAYEVCVYERLCSMATTVDLGNVIGPQGPQGVQGPKGETGPAGANWYVLGIARKDYNKPGTFLLDNSGGLNSNISDAFNSYPYVVCRLRYDNHITAIFVPTAYYDKWSDSANKYENYIQFSCLTLKGTSDTVPYYNNIVICENGTITGSVKDVDPAVDWSNIANRPFNGIGSAPLGTNSAGELICNVNIITPLGCSQYPEANELSLAIGEGATAASKQDIAIGLQAQTTAYNTQFASGDNIAIGTGAACADTAQVAIAIGNAAAVTSGSGISIGHSASATTDGSISLGNNTQTSGSDAVAIGSNATCKFNSSVALGTGSIATSENEVSVGSADNPRRITYVAEPTHSYEAVNLAYFHKNSPFTIKLCDNVSTSTAALDTNKTFAGFSNITIDNLVYNQLYMYMYRAKMVPDSIIFETTGSSTSPTKRQVFAISQCQHIYINNILNLNLLADCFVNFGMITNASSTMLNLARVELSITSKTEIMMNVSSASAMSIDTHSTYAMYLSLKRAA